MSSVITARGLTKRYGTTKAIDGLDFNIESGRIVGLIGPNGSGKTTTLKALLGLIPVEGALTVLGLNPVEERYALMESVSFIADSAILPRWIRVSEIVDFVEGVHPKFQRTKALRYIENTKLTPKMKVKEMSKGMIVQLHLALIMAIDSKLLVLDEPTLGLDIIHRQMFYRNLLDDYFDETKTIIISTHQIEEIEHVVSDLMFINDGHLVLAESMDSMGRRFTELVPHSHSIEEALMLKPIDSRTTLGSRRMLFDGVNQAKLSELGDIKVPSLSDVFVATIQGAQR